MIYSRTSMKQKMNRLMAVLLVTFLLGSFVGVGATKAYYSFTSASDVPKYGDTKTFTEEMSMDWENGYELGFKSLDIPIDDGLQEFIYCLSYGYNIDYAFVLALIDQESAFDISCISETADYGLFQINKVNHETLMEKLGMDDIGEPYQNARAGLFMLRKLFEKYEDPSKVLMAYNMGETGATILWEKGVMSTPYSEAIMEKAKTYKESLNGKVGK